MPLKQNIQRFISKRRFSFLSSIDADGFPNSKAMLAPRKIVDGNVFYFSTNTSSLRVKQFQQNPKACLYFCSPLFFKGVMLRGRVEVLHDAALKEALWKKGDTQYYPQGITDPDYCVLRFTADDTPPRTYRL